MKAYLKSYRQSPRKVRLVADVVRGKQVADALVQLDVLAKRAAHPIKKLINSAIANAKHNDKAELDKLFVKEMRVDQGVTLKRYRPRARGAAGRINKRTSNITLVLGEKDK
jgi:large subunit ribosomal protein L22